MRPCSSIFLVFRFRVQTYATTASAATAVAPESPSAAVCTNLSMSWDARCDTDATGAGVAAGVVVVGRASVLVVVLVVVTGRAAVVVVGGVAAVVVGGLAVVNGVNTPWAHVPRGGHTSHRNVAPVWGSGGLSSTRREPLSGQAQALPPSGTLALVGHAH